MGHFLTGDATCLITQQYSYHSHGWTGTSMEWRLMWEMRRSWGEEKRAFLPLPSFLSRRDSLTSVPVK